MERDPMIDLNGPQEPTIVITELDHILNTNDLGALSGRSMDELRQLRDELASIENGLSFVRRMAQGRLDIVLAEFQGRLEGKTETTRELLERLPQVLSGQIQGSGLPRHIQNSEIPAFADKFLVQLDELLHPSDLTSVEGLEVSDLDSAAHRIADFERALSAKRSELHRLIDEVQEEIIGRYRTGSASVDDLLKR